jgi:exodeoxyribonuclease-3
MRIITINLNGIRSAQRKGCLDWLSAQQADVICMQELKAQESDLQHPHLQMEGYHAFYHCAEKKGYSGVAIYTKHKPQQVVTGLGFATADQEGRHVAVKLGKLWVSSLYLPSGTSSEERQEVKYDFLDKYENYLRQLDGEHIICGDWNVAHKNIDLKNWKTNQKNSGFLPAERAWLDKLFGEIGFVDAFREVNQEPEQYTWWSHRGRAWEKNVGWRIDYQIITPGLKPTIKSAMIYTEQRFSDHAPLMMDYDIIL